MKLTRIPPIPEITPTTAPSLDRGARKSDRRTLRRRRALIVSLVALGFVTWHPPQGLQVRLCVTQLAFDIPCPGCGITRSMSCTVRGMFDEALALNPFGPLAVAILTTLAIASLLPHKRVTSIRRRIGWTAKVQSRCACALAVAMICFGVVRAAMSV